MASTPSMDLLLLILPLAFAVAFLIAALREWWLQKRLETNGRETNGEITELRNDSRAGVNYRTAEYTYEVNAHPSLVTIQPISGEHYNRLQKGDLVTVRYLPTGPHIARLAGKDRDDANRRALQSRALLILGVWVILLVVWAVQR
jgi:Protein of unknown function (DUF3592)